jgi:deazaflavin-dependent oxidoreductase (nitroreductase family)
VSTGEIRDPFGADLVAWGRALALTTRGRRTGRPVIAVVGFVEETDGSYRVAAGNPDAHWAANLRADPACTTRVGEVVTARIAEELDGDEKARTVVDLILRYGTPAESLGIGPAFRLRPA